MKIDLEELSLGRVARAEEIVVNSPDVEVPDRTTIAPEGGEVRTAAREMVQRVAKKHETNGLNIIARILGQSSLELYV